ncbi:putative RNA-directed DNA polymerase [Helianthus annuus]|nr:putative RNA-directed DNA polymerase [Helianthus annuus]
MDTLKSSAENATADRGKPPLQVKGIASRIVNIDGNPLLPRRGTVTEPKKINIIDELTKVTIPVSLDEDSPTCVASGSGKDDQAAIMGEKVDNGNASRPRSYADSLNANKVPKLNFRSLTSEKLHEGCDVVLSKESVRVARDKMANTLYGYFLGDRVAFPVVDYYVRNNWKKYGIIKAMMNDNGFFFFKFSDEAGMLNVLKGGPWIIRSQPLCLNVWSPTTKLEKKGVKSVQIWVKIHDVPIAAYTEDGLSLIATTIGVPKALDSYTSAMCMDMWGRSSYARALIEVSADKQLREEISLAIPEPEGEGFIKESLSVEYEWNPLRCSHCSVFGHSDLQCPCQPKSQANVRNDVKKGKKPVVDAEGYTGVYGKKAAKKPGFPINKPKQKFEYRPVGVKKNLETSSGSREKSTPSFHSANPFDALNDPTANEVDERNNSGDASKNVQDEVQDEVRQAIKDFKLSLCAVLETHVDPCNLSNICKSVFRSWNWFSNGARCNKGTRIIVGWNPNIFDAMVLSQTDQVMHLQLFLKQQKKTVFCSIIYAANYYISRRDLWSQLSVHKAFVHDAPWVLLGDFNSALNLEDKSMGNSVVSASMREFQSCIADIEVLDVNRSGCHFTWSQKPRKGIGLMKKIDRVLGNSQFIALFPNAVAMFHPARLSDHCVCVLKIQEPGNLKHKPFKFANFLVHKPEFLDIVKRRWDMRVEGVFQFSVVKKLKMLKTPLRVLLFQQGNLHQKVQVLRDKLDGIQISVDNDPSSELLREEEVNIRRAYQEALLDEERFLKQKSKVDWLAAGDMNSAFFHSSLKNKVHHSRINVIRDTSGKEYEDDLVQLAFVNYYENFLGGSRDSSLMPAPDLFSKSLDVNAAAHMVRPVSAEEVKNAMFSMGSDKAPGPDGFTAGFFKGAWPVVGCEVTNAVRDFFIHGKLLRELNHTLIVLLPKSSSPSIVTDYRPIACCNVLYKCISKIIADRIKVVLDDIVSINQSAFVPGRKISDNILLTQELMHNYHRNIGPPKCAFKVDIQKAYDTVDWKFLKSILLGFGFHQTMVHWIMLCVSTTTFSVCVNGEIHGYFKGSRGLRQGDPVSPYLFTLVMEILTAILQHSVRIDSSFKFHNRCERQQIINLCFADDLFIFSKGEIASARCIMKSLETFANMSGLFPSVQKSTVYFSNVPSYVKNAILNIMPFKEGSLPVKYLGVPLIASRLLYKDCQILIEMLENRIMHWRNKLLSFAGRLQLISSVLSSLHIYWSSVFMLPKRVIVSLEALMRNFLWSHDKAFQKGRAKVSWKTVCVPKLEGGLGIRRIGDVNIALITAHIWSIITNRRSLWVEWVHAYRLRGKSIWACKVPSACCWTWRKILQLRPLVRSYFWTEIGNGSHSSAWFDNWCELGPLEQFFSPRLIANAGFHMHSKVSEVYSDNGWRWPLAWREVCPALDQIDRVSLQPNKSDKFWWRHGNDKLDFSSSRVWDSIRHREDPVNWCGIVWFSQCIPRHAFLMWLVMKRKLLTQDKILSWDISRRKNMNMLCCLLCYANHDSHHHLFFECKFSAQVWSLVRPKVGMELVQPKWEEIVNWLRDRVKSKAAKDYVARLLVAATTYFIWQERNARLFKNQLRPPEAISELITQQVRYKLMGAKLKDCANVRRLLGDWEIKSAEMKEDGS